MCPCVSWQHGPWFGALEHIQLNACPQWLIGWSQKELNPNYPDENVVPHLYFTCVSSCPSDTWLDRGLAESPATTAAASASARGPAESLATAAASTSALTSQPWQFWSQSLYGTTCTNFCHHYCHYGTEWPVLCRCAIKQLLTHLLSLLRPGNEVVNTTAAVTSVRCIVFTWRTHRVRTAQLHSSAGAGTWHSERPQWWLRTNWRLFHIYLISTRLLNW